MRVTGRVRMYLIAPFATSIEKRRHTIMNRMEAEKSRQRIIRLNAKA